jgi:hypothetical protein
MTTSKLKFGAAMTWHNSHTCPAHLLEGARGLKLSVFHPVDLLDLQWTYIYKQRISIFRFDSTDSAICSSSHCYDWSFAVLHQAYSPGLLKLQAWAASLIKWAIYDAQRRRQSSLRPSPATPAVQCCTVRNSAGSNAGCRCRVRGEHSHHCVACRSPAVWLRRCSAPKHHTCCCAQGIVTAWLPPALCQTGPVHLVTLWPQTLGRKFCHIRFQAALLCMQSAKVVWVDKHPSWRAHESKPHHQSGTALLPLNRWPYHGCRITAWCQKKRIRGLRIYGMLLRSHSMDYVMHEKGAEESQYGLFDAWESALRKWRGGAHLCKGIHASACIVG